MVGFLYYSGMDKFDIICELYTKFNDITFEEGPHKYYDSDGNKEKYMSGSRFSSQFLRDPFENKKEMMAEKKAKDLGKTKEEVLKMWEHNNTFACNMGTDVHLAAELSWQHKLYDIDKNVEHYDTFMKMREKYYKFYNDAKDLLIPIKNELVVYDKELKICGTIDFLCYRPADNSFLILDWKTNNKLTRNSFKHYNKETKRWEPTMMLAPFDDLEECHLSEYSMQLSLYKLILERNTSIKISELILVHMDPNLEYPEIIPCIDLSDRILEYLKKQNNIT